MGLCIYFNFTAFIHFFNITFLRNYKILFNLECQAAIFTADPVVFSLLLGGMSTGPTGHSPYWPAEEQLKFSAHKYTCMDIHVTWTPVESWMKRGYLYFYLPMHRPSELPEFPSMF